MTIDLERTGKLVHLYWNVDASELHRILQTRLDDFERFIAMLGASVSRG